jgi:hypothetical protein
MYREKYLKYKKKYLELKAMEEELNAGSSFLKSMKDNASKGFNAAKKKAQSMTGTTPQDGFNGKVLEILQKETKVASDAANKVLSGLESAQQKQILAGASTEFADGRLPTSRGPVSKAIRAITGIVDADGKEIKKTTPEAELKAVMQKLHKQDAVAPVYSEMVSKGIKAVYGEVSKKAGDKTVAAHPAGSDDSSTVKSIIAINKQLDVDALCKAQGLATGVSACSQEKINALKYALKEVDALEKAAEKANKGLKASEDSRKKAQDAIDAVGKANGATGASTFESATKAVADSLTSGKAEVVKSIGVTVTGPVNKESLIKAIGAAEKVTVPAPKSPTTPKTPPTPTPEAVAAKK